MLSSNSSQIQFKKFVAFPRTAKRSSLSNSNRFCYFLAFCRFAADRGCGAVSLDNKGASPHQRPLVVDLSQPVRPSLKLNWREPTQPQRGVNGTMIHRNHFSLCSTAILPSAYKEHIALYADFFSGVANSSTAPIISCLL